VVPPPVDGVPPPRDDADVRRYVAALGLPGLADVHVHFMPHRVMRKVWEVFDRADEVYGVPWPVEYRVAEEERLALLRQMGVRVFTSLVYAHKPEMAEWLTGWSLEFAARTPGCVPTGTFFPELAAARYVAQALEDGARVFKTHVQVGDFDPRDPLLDPVWGLLAEAGVPVVVHCGSGPIPGRFTGPGPVGEVLATHPKLSLVVAHLGMPEVREFVDLAARYPGVGLDTTMAGTDFMNAGFPIASDLVPALRELALAGRVHLGSDFPNIPYPYAHQLQALHRLGLGDDALRGVLWRNPVALLRADVDA
jgi:hypothetical protein